jgi:ABC-type transport system, involved in lipoprotein release, permease component
VAVGVPVAAMIILLSVFNGFEGLVRGMFNDFDPDLMVTPVEGKVFTRELLPRERLMAVEGVAQVSAVLEDNVLFEYRGRQFMGTARGVDSLYADVVPIGKMVVAGEYDLHFGDLPQAVVGRGLGYALGVSLALSEPLSAIVPRRGVEFSPLLPLEGYRRLKSYPSGVFALDMATDGQYAIVPIEFTQELLDYPGMVSALVIRTTEGADPVRVREAVAREMGPEFEVRTRYQQKASLYKIMSYEKWGIFLIIFLVMVIASFSLVGSLAMLIIDKRGDMRTMVAMGMPVGTVRSIFVREGMLISLIGGACGLAFGLLLCWAQIEFGLISIPADSFLVTAYPVAVKAWDVALVAAVFIAVNYIIAKFTAAGMIPKSNIRL